MSIVQDPSVWIENAALNQPHRAFLRTPSGRVLTYVAVEEQTRRVAAAVMSLGVAPGDRVAAQVDKSVEAVLLYLACLRLGAAFVPINVANTVNEVEYFLRDSAPTLLVVRPPDRGVLEPLARGAGVRCVETLGTCGEGSLLEHVAAHAAGALAFSGNESDLAAIVYTSGTTGRSKGAMLTRGNLGSNAAVLAHAWRFTGTDVLMHTLPLFHVHGLFVAINTVLASASSLLLLPKFEAAAVLAHLSEVSVYMGVPTHYTRLLQEPGLDRASSASVRLFVSGSAPLLAETHREFMHRTGHTILERYGMTETLMITSNPYEGTRLAGSVGLPLPGVSIRISPAEAGSAMPDAIGVLEVRGPNVFAGYWRDSAKTRGEFTADGWFKTGDLGRIRDGYVYIVGRAKDLVISGGYNVYPKEVEAELDAVPGVFESAVFGVPHPDLGEGVTAAVVVKPDAVLEEAEIIGRMKARLAGYKIPKRVIFVAELPRNAMGKVQKNALRATHARLYRT